MESPDELGPLVVQDQRYRVIVTSFASCCSCYSVCRLLLAQGGRGDRGDRGFLGVPGEKVCPTC